MLRELINKIKPLIMASVRLPKVTIQSQKTIGSNTMVVEANLLPVSTMRMVTKNAADQVLVVAAPQEATRGLLALAKEALVALTTGMLTLKLSLRFTSLLLRGSLVKMTLEESLESSEVLRKS